MPWLAVDVVLVLAALVLLAVVGLRLWRSVKALGSRVSEAGERLGAALDDLERVQAGGPQHAGDAVPNVAGARPTAEASALPER